MTALFYVGLGGALGVISRYKLGGVIFHHTVNWKFPFSTFVVNVLGCLVAGFLAGAIERWDILSPHMRLFVLTGFLGGFTTFSAFGLETILLIKEQQFLWAFMNIMGSVSCGLFALWIGLKVLTYST